MFGIGSTELLVILLVALIVLGPKSLASVSRTLGKAMGEFRRVSTDFQRTLNMEAAEQDLREAEKKRNAEQPGVKTQDRSSNTTSQNQASAVQTQQQESPLAEALAKAKIAAEAASEKSDNSTQV